MPTNSFLPVPTLTRTWSAVLFDLDGTLIHSDSEHQVSVIPGVRGLLERLRDAGIPVALATSQPEPAAIALLELLDLSEFFRTCVGTSIAEQRNRDADVIGEALLRLSAAGFDIESPVMVGDRSADTEGAAEHGIPTIMVEWGQGNPSEATAALAVVASTDQLRGLLLGA